MARTMTGGLLRRFGEAREGHVAIIFAAVLVPVIGITSAAIDFGRAAKVRSTLLTATSAAAQAGSAKLLLDDSNEAEREVARLLAANLPPELKGLPHRVKIASDRSLIEVAMETTVPTTLMGVMGISELGVEATGSARPVLAVAAPAPQPGPGPGSDPASSAAIGRAQGGIANGIVGGAAAGAGSFGAGSAPIRDKAELRAAVRDLAAQLMASQRAGSSVPPPSPAEVEQLMRELRRHMR